jgi:hypothetical protein
VRKLALAIVLVLVLVGGALGGMAVATATNGSPTLSAVGNSAPGLVSITGLHWTPGVPVNLYMDYIDVAHHVAVATPNSVGRFVQSFVVGPTTLGGHTIFGVQNGGAPVPALFTITSTQQLDDRTWDAWQNIGTEVGNIESKLDNTTYGLQQTEKEVSDIEGNMTMFYATRGDRYVDTTTGVSYLYTDYDWQTRHVNLTVVVCPNGGTGNASVYARIGPPGGGAILCRMPPIATVTYPSSLETISLYQFDTSHWELWMDAGSTGTDFDWEATTITGANQEPY